MTYATTANVAAYTPQLLASGGTDFSAATTPTATQVTIFLKAGFALINARLNSEGYSTPLPASSEAADFAKDVEALYGAGRAEMVRSTARVAATERTRSQQFMEQFNTGLDALVEINFALSGASRASRMYAGGISVADKDAQNADQDRVKGRFERGQFRAPETSRPSGTRGDDETA